MKKAPSSTRSGWWATAIRQSPSTPFCTSRWKTCRGLRWNAWSSNRLASYTEKSTRYQTWDPEHFYVPPELEAHRLRAAYVDVCRALFAAYQESIPAVKAVIARENPPQPGESEARWERRVRSEYVDVCRFFLPAASLANVGMTINARALEHAITKMLSHPLEEVRQLGAEIKQVARAEVPTLVKYADASPYLQQAYRALSADAAALPAAASGAPGDWCALVHFDREAEERVLAAALYRFGGFDYTQAVDCVRQSSPEERSRRMDSILADIGPHDNLLRELEHVTFTFDLTVDQGAYFELKRHRMMTLTPQPLTARLGYPLPRRIVTAGLEQLFRRIMEQARSAYEQIAAFNPEVAAYIVPNAYNRRALITINLRSLAHLLQLRSADNAHFSMRRLARRMAAQVQSVSPILARCLRLPEGETWESIEQKYFWPED